MRTIHMAQYAPNCLMKHLLSWISLQSDPGPEDVKASCTSNITGCLLTSATGKATGSADRTFSWQISAKAIMVPAALLGPSGEEKGNGHVILGWTSLCQLEISCNTRKSPVISWMLATWSKTKANPLWNCRLSCLSGFSGSWTTIIFLIRTYHSFFLPVKTNHYIFQTPQPYLCVGMHIIFNSSLAVFWGY